MKIIISKTGLDKYLSTVCISILLFLYFYTPFVKYIPLNFGYLSFFAACVYFSFNSNVTKLLKLLGTKPFLTFLYFYIFCIIYTIVVFIISDETDNKAFLITYIRLLIDIVFVVPFFVIFLKDELDYDTDKILKKFLVIGVVQGVCATVMLIVPPLKDFIFAYFIDIPSDKLLSEGYRGFGIASDFYFSMPLFQAIIFAINTKFYVEKGGKYLYNYPFLLISMLLNARISIIIIPVLFIVILIMSFYYDELKWIKKLSNLLIVGLVFVLIVVVYFLFNPDKFVIVSYLAEGLTGIFGVLTGTGHSSTLNIILSRHIHFPQETAQVIFGKGQIVFGNANSPVQSDLGYIRYIYYGGILLSVMFYFNFYNFAKSCILLEKDKFFKIILISVTVMMFIAHAKGDVFNSSAFLKGALILQVFILYKNESSCSIIKK